VTSPTKADQQQKAIHPAVQRVRNRLQQEERMEQSTEKGIQQANRSTFEYWIPKPTLKGWRVRGLTFVNVMTALGLGALAVVGFISSQIRPDQVESFASLRWYLILVGSICLALGSEIGTFVTTLEVFHKQKMGSRRPLLARVLISVLAVSRAMQVVREARSQMAKDSTDKTFSRAIKMIDRVLERQERGTSFWDWVGMGISIITSLSAVSMAYVSGLSLSESTYTWLPIVQQWSPAALWLFGVLDGYVNHSEFGLFFASFDEQVKKWYADREAARKEVERIER